MNEVPPLKRQCPVLDLHTIPQSEGAPTRDYWVLVLPTQVLAMFLSQRGGKSTWGTLSVITYHPQTFSLSYVNSTSSDEFCLKASRENHGCAFDLSLSGILRSRAHKAPGDSAGKSGIWQRGMKDLFLASALSSFEMICQVRMIQGLMTIHSELLGSE